MSNNFYLVDGYHADVKIIELTNKLPILKFIYLNKNISNILLDTTEIDLTNLFVNDKINIVEIYNNKFIITRHKNENWNLVLAIFLSYINEFLSYQSNIDYLPIIEKKLNNYKEYQLKNTENTIIINSIYYAVNKIMKRTFDIHKGGFEIIELDKYNKIIYIRLNGSCAGCNDYQLNLKEIIYKEIKKIINYKIVFE